MSNEFPLVVVVPLYNAPFWWKLKTRLECCGTWGSVTGEVYGMNKVDCSPLKASKGEIKYPFYQQPYYADVFSTAFCGIHNNINCLNIVEYCDEEADNETDQTDKM